MNSSSNPETPPVTDSPDARGGIPPGLARDYLDALLQGDRRSASRQVLAAVERGVPVKSIYLDVFQPAQHELGRLWEQNRISIAQEHFCTAATQMVMSQLYAHIFPGTRNGRAMVATSVSGDLHELGARMVADFFEMHGWSTYFTGANTPTPDVLRAVVDRRASLLAISASMPEHVETVRELVGAARADVDCREVRILVGGHPFNRLPDLWKEIGADGFAADAQAAVDEAERLLGGARRLPP